MAFRLLNTLALILTNPEVSVSGYHHGGYGGHRGGYMQQSYYNRGYYPQPRVYYSQASYWQPMLLQQRSWYGQNLGGMGRKRGRRGGWGGKGMGGGRRGGRRGRRQRRGRRGMKWLRRYSRPTEENLSNICVKNGDGEFTNNIGDIIVNSPRFTTLTAALQKANLVDTLNSDTSEFTLFAPTDPAFGRFLAKAGLNATQLLDSPDLASILLFHVLPQDSVIQGLNGSYATASGKNLTVATGSGRRGRRRKNINNQATVIRANRNACNGRIQVINAVLSPPTDPSGVPPETSEGGAGAPSEAGAEQDPDGKEMDGDEADDDGDKPAAADADNGADDNTAGNTTSADGADTADAGDDGDEPAANNPAADSDRNGTADAPADDCIPLGTVLGIPDVGTLAAALNASDLTSAITSNITVFAPNNTAFDQLLSDTNSSSCLAQGGANLLDTQRQDCAELLQSVLLYHVVPDSQIESSDLVGNQTLTTAQGEAITTQGADINNGTNPTIVDIKTCEGPIIHVVDKVLLPPSVTGGSDDTEG